MCLYLCLFVFLYPPIPVCLQWLEYFLAYCGALAFEGDPIEWSKNHRWHHQNSDSSADRHSPRDGLWHAHMGWLFDESLTNTRCVSTWGRRAHRGRMHAQCQACCG